ncbi:hypothetical protein K3495_g16823 [Podosphaera aphanis]|nr:hypothetical protein K3495_g16823 [Podosphaera aphanis]
MNETPRLFLPEQDEIKPNINQTVPVILFHDIRETVL